MYTPGLRAIRTHLDIHRTVSPESSEALREVFGATRTMLVQAQIPCRITQHGPYQLPLLTAREFENVSRRHSELLNQPFEDVEDSCKVALFSQVGSELSDVALDGVTSYCMLRNARARLEMHALSLSTPDPRIRHERQQVFKGLARAAHVSRIPHKDAELPMFITGRPVPDKIIEAISQLLPRTVDLQPIEISTPATEIEYTRSGRTVEQIL